MSPDTRPPAQSDRPSPTLDPATSELIRGKARQVARRCGQSPSELADIEQDITLHVWERLGRFDTDRTDLAVFIRMLVAHATATTLRGRRRWLRRAPQSLDAILQAEDGGMPDPRAWPGPEQAVALTLDVEAVLAILPRRLRRAAKALRNRTVTEAARHLRVSRATIYRRIGEIRRYFEAVGLDPL